MKYATVRLHALGAALAAMAIIPNQVGAQSTPALAQYPLFLAAGVNPNVLIVLDNSGSMDSLMNGQFTKRSDPNTRSNIVRKVLRDTIITYRSQINWGLMIMNLPQTTAQCNKNPYGAYQTGWTICAQAIGTGTLVESAQADSDTQHINALTKTALAPVASNVNEVLNGDGTPSEGSMYSAGAYFAGKAFSNTYNGFFTGPGTSKYAYTSPISLSCQKNFVMFATDGEPNEDIHANQTASQTQLLKNISNMHQTVVSSGPASTTGLTFDVQTYVIGVADAVSGGAALSSLNDMALAGGTGSAYLANDASTFEAAVGSIVSSIEGKNSAAGSVAVSSSTLQTSNAAYQATFDSNHWAGDLLSFNIATDPTKDAGSNNPPVLAKLANWSAAKRLQALPPNNRSIVTFNGSSGVAFRWPAKPSSPSSADIPASLVSALNTNASGVVDNNGSTRLAYLRGDQSNEAGNCSGTCVLNYRPRVINVADSNTVPKATTPSVLGDITESSPVYVGRPNSGYDDDLEASAYSSFVSAQSGRTPILYVGANDGMLHGFKATTGDEVLAYVPRQVFGRLSQLTNRLYTHLNFVNGDPYVADVFYGGAWHSLLSSGLRSGGTGIFTLDVTDPMQFAETKAANIVRWDFDANRDADMGYVFGHPIMVKTNTGAWAVIVGNGYYSSNRSAVLFVIDAQTGSLIKKIDTGVAGSSASPNGLSGPAAIDINHDGKADYVYAGDMLGNMWKFDLSAMNPGAWGVALQAKPLFSAGASQPITAQANVGTLARGGQLVTFGTGSFVSTSDLSNSGQQTLYGIWDKVNNSTGVPLSSLVKQQYTTGSSPYASTTHAVGPPSDASLTGDNTISSPDYFDGKLGWYLPLHSGGERVTGQAYIADGRVMFTSFTPIVSSCESSGSSRQTIVMLDTGNRPGASVLDVNNDHLFTAADLLNGAVANTVIMDGISQATTVLKVPPNLGPGNCGPSGQGCPQTIPTSTDCQTNINLNNASTGTVLLTYGKGSCGNVTRSMWRQAQ